MFHFESRVSFLCFRGRRGRVSPILSSRGPPCVEYYCHLKRTKGNYTIVWKIKKVSFTSNLKYYVTFHKSFTFEQCFWVTHYNN